MSDMSPAIIARSDQLNADDLIGGPRTIRITKVIVRGGDDQPVTINYENDDGRPYRPCKSMSRVLVHVWGLNPNNYVGKSLTLYRDPAVKWGGLEVGGIRISHMSDMGDAKRAMPLTVTRGSKKLYTVQPLNNQEERSGTAREAPSSDQGIQSAAHTEQASTPPPPSPAGEEAGAPEIPADASAFTFTLTDSKGATRTTSAGEQWAATLISLIEKKPFDTAQRTWRDNAAHVEAARNGGHPELAIKVEAAWRKRERAASDTARGG